MDARTIMIGRREFTLEAVLALLSGVVITITGCGGGNSPTSPSPSPSPSPSSGDKTGQISNNHGHSAVITSAQVSAGNAVTLHIQGVATHDHTVELSGSQILSIAGGQVVSKSSSTDVGHDHTVTFNG